MKYFDPSDSKQHHIVDLSTLTNAERQALVRLVEAEIERVHPSHKVRALEHLKKKLRYGLPVN